MNKLIVSLSPHVHGGDSVKKNMYGVLIALIPAFLVSLYFFGLGALIGLQPAFQSSYLDYHFRRIVCYRRRQNVFRWSGL